MSRIGRMPIEIPKGVDVKIIDGQISVKGPKGSMNRKLVPKLTVKIEDNKIMVSRESNEKKIRAFHGLYRTLINNMVEGVTKGFEKRLTLSGVGYRGQKEGKKLILQLGFSHNVVFDPPEGINLEVKGPEVIVSGIDKELIGQIAANIRSSRKVEPYKAKGIRYSGEIVRRKAGKAAKAAGTAAAKTK